MTAEDHERAALRTLVEAQRRKIGELQRRLAVIRQCGTKTCTLCAGCLSAAWDA